MQMVQADKQTNPVSYLTVTAGLHHGHNHILRGHEGQFLADTTRNDLQLYGKVLVY